MHHLRTVPVPYLPIVVFATTVAFTASLPLQAQSVPGSPEISGFLQAGMSANLIAESYQYLPTTPAKGDEYSFHLHQARIYLNGALDRGFGYSVKVNFARGFSLLAAHLIWRSQADFEIRAGKMLKPFSRDRLRAPSRLLTLNRSVGTLRGTNGLRYGGFDTGVMVTASPGPIIQAGLFNGSGVSGHDYRDTETGKNLVGRISLPLAGYEVSADFSLLRLGPTLAKTGRDNLAWGIDAAGTLAGIFGELEILCADNWSLFDPGTGHTPRMWSAVATAVLPLPKNSGAGRHELIARLERFDASDEIAGDEVWFITPNLTIPLAEASRLQAGLQYEIPADHKRENALSIALLWQIDFSGAPRQ